MTRIGKWAAAAAIAASFGFGAAPGAWAQACKPRLEEAQRSVVRVLSIASDKRSIIGWGTGWVIEGRSADRANNAVIATSFHVIQRGSYVKVIKAGESDGVMVRALTSPRETSYDHDLAFLELEGFDAPALQINRDAPTLSDQVYALGYTSSSDAQTQGQLATTASATDGAVARLFQGPVFGALSQTPVSQVEHNAPIQAGYSGGPLLDGCGKVIGMNVADGGHRPLPFGFGTIQVSSGTSFAIGANELVAEAKRLNVNFVTASKPVAPGATVPPPTASAPLIDSPFENIIRALQNSPLMLIGLIVAALALVGAGVWLLRPTGGKVDPVPPAPVEPTVAPVSPSSNTGPTLVLTGRGPSGEALRFSFSAEQAAGGAEIGSDRSRVKAAIDDRKDYVVSRVHAKLDYDGSGFTLEDSKSTNGTKVGGVKLAPHKPQRLMDGDEVEFGDVKMRVSVQS